MKVPYQCTVIFLLALSRPFEMLFNDRRWFYQSYWYSSKCIFCIQKCVICLKLNSCVIQLADQTNLGKKKKKNTQVNCKYPKLTNKDAIQLYSISGLWFLPDIHLFDQSQTRGDPKGKFFLFISIFCVHRAKTVSVVKRQVSKHFPSAYGWYWS